MRWWAALLLLSAKIEAARGPMRISLEPTTPFYPSAVLLQTSQNISQMILNGSFDDPNHVCQCNGNGYCRGISCACQVGWGGSSCGIKACPNNCTGHGACASDGTCECNEGYGGLDCSYRACPDPTCSDNGVCLSIGKCQCYPGFSGPACADSETSGEGCPHDCHGRGICRHGSCYCASPWTGPSCQERICPDHCNGRGLCLSNHTCACNHGYHGDACELMRCNVECLNGGHCDGYTGKCKCLDKYWGETCEKKHCINDCSGNGRCLSNHTFDLDGHRDFRCECDEGWEGESCEKRKCEPLWGGPHCRDRRCYDDCNGPHHGVCDIANNYTCNCINGWVGESCNLRPCPKACNNHGICNNGTCSCSPYWEGDTCDVPTCPLACHHGSCTMTLLRGGTPPPKLPKRHQSSTFPSGSANGSLPKIIGHLAQGASTNGAKLPVVSGDSYRFAAGSPHRGAASRMGIREQLNMVAHQAFKAKNNNYSRDEENAPQNGAKAWDLAATPLRGWEIEALQRSRSGILTPYHGLYVDELHDLGGSLMVVKRSCMCDYGYGGQNCEHRYCPNDCSGHGYCGHEGQCFCDVNNGWGGVDCSEKLDDNQGALAEYQTLCEQNCVHGKCVISYTRLQNGNLTVTSTCQCKATYTGKDCSVPVLFPCPKNCSGNGACGLRGCDCEAGWHGLACDVYDPDRCRDDCNGRGSCNHGVCNCTRPWSGRSCSKKSCPGYPNQCSGNGLCDTGSWKCLCYPSFEGEDCSRPLSIADLE